MSLCKLAYYALYLADNCKVFFTLGLQRDILCKIQDLSGSLCKLAYYALYLADNCKVFFTLGLQRDILCKIQDLSGIRHFDTV